MADRPADVDLAARTVAAVFREHHGELVRLALLMVGDLPTAEDVVQDVYASLHKRWSRVAADDAPLPYVRAYRDTQVRSLSVATGGGALDSGALLLTQSARYPVIADAIAGPVAGSIPGGSAREGSTSSRSSSRISDWRSRPGKRPPAPTARTRWEHHGPFGDM
jgi:hypothetical protein